VKFQREISYLPAQSQWGKYFDSKIIQDFKDVMKDQGAVRGSQTESGWCESKNRNGNRIVLKIDKLVLNSLLSQELFNLFRTI
jgi:hypothetical protein